MVGRVWSRETTRFNAWSSGRKHVLPLKFFMLSDNPYRQRHTNVNEGSTNMTQESYTVTAHTTDPAAANLILAAVIDEARRTGAQVNIGGRVPAPNGSIVNVKAAQGDQLADAADMFLTWAEAAEKPRLMHTPADVATMLGVSARTLGEWRFTGDGPEFVKVGSVVRYPHDALTDWMAANRRATA